ncbi:flavin reductase family protein [Arenibacterium halophilum]|uniref:Flavin reductase n=1 Tax=Arenibacterium halophilum TaxID=2583821 RepID=A0ABY2XA38_9RHOB|nr:flavin reductase family protein [Arenibacterium halophilum]TMV13244.1 flavin reductase [Arenibacterium halophilum]
MTLHTTPAVSSAGIQQDFRDAMAALAATTCVVTCHENGARWGRTVTAVFSLAVEPPAILVSIRADSELADMICRTAGFSFAMLSESQHAVADAFAGKVARAERFQHGDWGSWPSGMPRLSGAVAAMDCTLGKHLETSGHILFVGHPQNITLDGKVRPLIWHDRTFNTVQPL